MAFRAPLPLTEVVDRLRRVVDQSPCDQTEVAWVEIVRAAVSHLKAEEIPRHVEATILVRVREGGRIGAYQTVPGTVGELAGAVRQALGQSRVQSPAPWRCPPAPSSEFVQADESLVDEELATLEAQELHRRLVDPLGPGERARLEWSVGRIVLANSSGLEQQSAATCATLEVHLENGGGRAAASARGLSALDLEGVVARARSRSGGPPPREGGGTDLETPGWVVLAPEAAIPWLALLNYHALSSRSFRLGTSCLRERLGQLVTAPGVRLVDDGTRSGGLPFPFDLYGWSKRPVPLIDQGVFRTPAVDRRLRDELGLDPTPHAVAFADSRPNHLFLGSVEDSIPGERELLERCDGGLWINALEHPECFDPGHGRFRARAVGVRRIEGGRLGARLPDLLWEDTLPDTLKSVVGLGGETVTLAQEDRFRGGVTAPSVALRGLRLRPCVT